MIPKVIHYCWFGRNPLPAQLAGYIETWREHCPDFEIIEWNEDNFDVSQNDYCIEAYKAKKWAFVSDYARLKIIHDHGGIYLDTDVEVLRPLTELIADGVGFVGFQNTEQVNTGLGFAAASQNPCIKKMLELYETRHFLQEDGSYDLTPCPVTNTVALKQCGLKTGKMASKNIQHLEGLNVLPIAWLNPLNADTAKTVITEDTYTIHHYAASWLQGNRRLTRAVKNCMPAFCLEIRSRYISRRDVRRMERNMRG